MIENENNLENLETPIGTLFDAINYYKIEDLDKFISEMSNDQAMYCIIQACHSGFKRNAYSMLESELLSKALRKISRPNTLETEKE